MASGKIYVIGSAKVILPFRAGGASLRPAEDAEGVGKELSAIKAEAAASLVLITEEAASKAADALKDFEEKGVHAIMVVPTKQREKSEGLERMRELIIRSVGVDLISKAPGAEIGEEIFVEIQ